MRAYVVLGHNLVEGSAGGFDSWSEVVSVFAEQQAAKDCVLAWQESQPRDGNIYLAEVRSFSIHGSLLLNLAHYANPRPSYPIYLLGLRDTGIGLEGGTANSLKILRVYAQLKEAWDAAGLATWQFPEGRVEIFTQELIVSRAGGDVGNAIADEDDPKDDRIVDTATALRLFY